jgi:hypothetical protein
MIPILSFETKYCALRVNSFATGGLSVLRPRWPRSHGGIDEFLEIEYRDDKAHSNR